MSKQVMLTGEGLTLEDLAAVADGADVGLSAEGLARMQAGRDVLEQALAEQRPMYGITTGLGPL